jgi:hypothetical protein
MRTQLAYCSVRARHVRVAVTDLPTHDGQAPLHDAELVCLDVGGHCTAVRCPVCGLPSEAVAARLVHNGLQTELNPIVKLSCPVCEHVSEYVVVDEKVATCVECGTTVDYASLPGVSGPVA